MHTKNVKKQENMIRLH